MGQWVLLHSPLLPPFFPQLQHTPTEAVAVVVVSWGVGDSAQGGGPTSRPLGRLAD